MSLNINLAKVRNNIGAVATYELTGDKLQLNNEVAINKPVNISITLTNNDQILEMKGNISTEIKASCHRCLEEFSLPINTVIEEELVCVADLRDIDNFTQEEVEERFLIFDDDIFDLTATIEENLILALPFKLLCSEECQGLCVNCGQNLNINNCHCLIEEVDPRLAILAKLKDTEEV